MSMKTIARNDAVEVLAGQRFKSNYVADIVIHGRHVADPRATFAQDMIRAWGMVAARPGAGFEPTDKRDVALMPAAEVVQRACDTADLAWKAFRERGWLLDVPSYEEVQTPPAED